MEKSPDAFRTISEVADWLDTPAHVLRFWESRFSQVKPVKRAGGRRYYRPADMALLGGIKKLLHEDGLTIRGVQKLLREHGVKYVAAMSPDIDGVAPITMTSAKAKATPPSESVASSTETPSKDRVPQAPMAEDVPHGAYDDAFEGALGDGDDKNGDKIVPFARPDTVSPRAETPNPPKPASPVPSMSDAPPVESFGKDTPPAKPKPAFEQPMFDFGQAESAEAGETEAEVDAEESAAPEPSPKSASESAVESDLEAADIDVPTAPDTTVEVEAASTVEEHPETETAKEAAPEPAAPAPTPPASTPMADAAALVPADPEDDAEGLGALEGVVGRLDKAALAAADVEMLAATTARVQALYNKLAGPA